MPFQAVRLALSPADRQRLESLAQSSDPTASRLARIMLMAADGFSNREIGRQLNISHQTVAYHRERYLAHGSDAVHRKGRPGRPRRLSGDKAWQLLQATAFRPKTGTVRTAAKAFKVSEASVSRFWKWCGLIAHQIVDERTPVVLPQQITWGRMKIFVGQHLRAIVLVGRNERVVRPLEFPWVNGRRRVEPLYVAMRLLRRHRYRDKDDLSIRWLIRNIRWLTKIAGNARRPRPDERIYIYLDKSSWADVDGFPKLPSGPKLQIHELSREEWHATWLILSRLLYQQEKTTLIVRMLNDIEWFTRSTRSRPFIEPLAAHVRKRTELAKRNPGKKILKNAAGGTDTTKEK